MSEPNINWREELKKWIGAQPANRGEVVDHHYALDPYSGTLDQGQMKEFEGQLELFLEELGDDAVQFFTFDDGDE